MRAPACLSAPVNGTDDLSAVVSEPAPAAPAVRGDAVRPADPPQWVRRYLRRADPREREGHGRPALPQRQRPRPRRHPAGLLLHRQHRPESRLHQAARLHRWVWAEG